MGFTLMEMLVVLTILALVAGMASQLTHPASPRLRVQAAARALCAAARATRTRAIATNTEATLTLDLARKSFFSPVVSETAFPREASVEVSFARAQRANRTSAGIVFYPGGGSTGGDVVIELSSHRATIGVNWLTGETTCDLT
ncbi:MAG: type II secretion system protein [Roseiarcus sp.]